MLCHAAQLNPVNPARTPALVRAREWLSRSKIAVEAPGW